MKTDQYISLFSARRLILSLFPVLFVLLLPVHHAQAAENAQKLVVFPFAVNAPDEFSYLGQDAPSLLRDKLQERGFQVVSGPRTQTLIDQSGVEELNTQTVKDLALQASADYAVFGSMNRVGRVLSFDVRLIDPLSTAAPRAFYATAEELILLQTALSDIADKIHNSLQRRKTVAQIEVQGNKVLGDDVVLMRLQLQEGDEYSAEAINEEIQRLFATGYFDDVKVHVQETAQGLDVIFEVQERPLLSGIEVRGNEAIDDDDIREAMSSKTDSVLNPKLLTQDLETIRELYRKKGYYKAQIDSSREETGTGKAKLVLDIDEGDKQYITNINIQGADQLSEGELKKQLALSERGLFSWITGSGILREEVLDRDASALEAYYANRGFMDVRVGHPEISYEEDGIHITFQVQEGPRYTVGDVAFDGDLIVDADQLRETTQIDNLSRENEPFSRSVLRQDAQELGDFYSNYGYAFAQASPSLRKNSTDKTIDVIYNITKNQQVYIRQVIIAGNQKTRDNVIRRELHLTGGERFSGQKLTLSKERLTRLDYFDDVEVETLPTQDPELMDIKVQVKEKSTGSFSAGAGFSSVDRVFFTGRIQERNLFGKGYNVSFQGSFSSYSTRFLGSFWNPHLYDGPVGAGVDLFNIRRDYDDYDLDTTGGKLKFAYTIGTYTRLFWDYSLQEYEVTDIEEDASDQIKDLSGKNVASKAGISAVRDTTDRRLNPTRGTKNTLSLEYAGGILGGDDEFIKPEYEFSYFHPLFWKVVFNWHWKLGWIFEHGDEEVPDYERYYLGGINTVRGYDWRDISITDDEGEDVGGYKSFYSNVEMVFPLKEDMGLLGVLFFDAGDVWDKNESIEPDLFKSIGAGVRWNSPMGPLRLEYGYPLDDLKDNDGKFEFTVGQFF
ncbi:MAG: outer membrane protein assembly factor BamA [Desulfovermiculus sp.]|nr:outer membrane protein assembly factor BamA [Desulfovermiculus sp.]